MNLKLSFNKKGWILIAVFSMAMLTGVLCMFPQDSSPYGHKTKSKFYQNASFTNFNHGSFGAVSREVKAAQDVFFAEAEEYPDKWFRSSIYENIKKARGCVAELINSTVEDVVLVENASAAINSVLRSIPFERGDKVLVLSTAYSMVTEVIGWLKDTRGIEIIVVNVNFPLDSNKQVLQAVSDTMEQHDNIKICVFSHITSLPSVILPINELVAMCKASDRNPNARILIDGAHAPGLITINMEQIGADYYTGNLHKWCFTPKGCAFLWTAQHRQKWEELAPSVIGSTCMHSYEDRFAYTGTRDYTAWATIPAAFAFCHSIGGHRAIAERNHDLIIRGAVHCAKTWDTELLAPKSMLASMADVVLPIQDEKAINNMVAILDSKYNTFIVTRPITFYPSGSTVWICRLSAQIYLEFSDFVKLADRVLELFDLK